MPEPHDRGDHTPLLRLIVVHPVEEGMGVDVGGEDVELADRHVVRGLVLCHVGSSAIAKIFLLVTHPAEWRITP